MNCDSIGDHADLYLYGELPSAQEEEFEQHLHECDATGGGRGHHFYAESAVLEA